LAVVLLGGLQVVVGVGDLVTGGAVADFEQYGRFVGGVDELCGDAGVGGEAVAVVGVECVTVITEYEGGVAAEDVDEFVLVAVVVFEGGDGAGGEFGEVDAEVGQAEVVAELAFFATGDLLGEGFRVMGGFFRQWNGGGGLGFVSAGFGVHGVSGLQWVSMVLRNCCWSRL